MDARSEVRAVIFLLAKLLFVFALALISLFLFLPGLVIIAIVVLLLWFAFFSKVSVQK
jgi:fatty acid desaturase